MSRIKYHIFVFLACFSSFIFSQQGVVEDEDMLSMRLQERVSQAKLESDRGDYYNALSNLEEAKKLAEKIEDQISLGTTLTKIAKVRYLVGETDKANVALSKAIELQRKNDDYGNLAVSYNIQGVVYSTNEKY